MENTKKNNFKKSVFWNTFGSGLISLNSLFFLIIVTRVNGIIDAGIFTFSFATANIFYTIALYSGRTYQVTDTDNEISDRDYIAHRLFTSLVMIFLMIIFILLNNYATSNLVILIILCLFKCIEAISDVFHGILQKNNRLDYVGKSLFFRAFFNLFFFVLVNILFNNLILACLSLVIINLFFLFFIDIKGSTIFIQRKREISVRAITKIFLLGGFTFGFVLLSNYVINAPRYSIDLFLSRNYQTIFGIIVMPATIIMLVNQFVIQPVIMELKKSFAENNKKQFIKIINILIFVTIGVGIVSVIIAYFFGIPFLNLLYGLNLESYLNELLLVLVGATFYTISCIYSSAMIVLRKTKVQLIIYSSIAIIAYFLCNILVKSYSFTGAIYSYLLVLFILMSSYIISYNIINKKIWN